MLRTTLDIIRSGLRSDPTLSAGERARILADIRNRTGANTAAVAAVEPRLIRRAEAARRLGCSLRLVDKLAQDGILPKRHLPNRKRGAGFLESDLNDLIVGRITGLKTFESLSLESGVLKQGPTGD